ncbi:MAG TPA: GNAT family N-acetyltransferase [Gemmatimonadales bacterium]|jgi:ribosomal protein S18 acetylase RimI-like enzyme
MKGTLTAPVIRALTDWDRPQVEEMTRACGVFRPEEVQVALDVFDAALGIGRKRDPDYETAGVELDGALAGWACWGPTPCTLGTFDLYWIVVAPECQGQGIGGALMAEMDRRIAGRARMIVVETAGRADYASTRAFYERLGYRVAARITDYYAPGDDLVTYVKRV